MCAELGRACNQPGGQFALGAAGSPTLYYRALILAPPSIRGLSVIACPGACLPPAAWQPSVAVDAAGSGGFASSVGGPGAGQVAAAYQDAAGALRFAAGGAPATLAAAGDWSALTVMPDGRYHAVYHADGALRHLTCPSSCGTTAWEGGTVDPTGDAGSYSSIAVDGAGRIHVAYRADVGAQLRYATCVSPCVPSAWIAGTIGPPGNDPIGMSLIATPTGIAMSYYDVDLGELKFGSCSTSCEQAGQWSFTKVSTEGYLFFTSYWTSLAQGPSGELVIAFQTLNGILRFATCPSDCAAGQNRWGVTLVSRLETIGEASAHPSLKIDALGKRHVAWTTLDHQVRYGVF